MLDLFWIMAPLHSTISNCCKNKRSKSMTENSAVMSLQDHIRSETKKNIVINLVLNAAIAYATLHSLAEISTWGEKGYGPDLIITGFLLSTILGGIFIGIFRRKRNKQEIDPLKDEDHALAKLLPYSPWLAAPTLGILGAVLAAPLLLGLLALLGVETLSPIAYAAIKGVWAAALAAVVVPIAIRQGLRATR
jgi:hypothetical protein